MSHLKYFNVIIHDSTKHRLFIVPGQSIITTTEFVYSLPDNLGSSYADVVDLVPILGVVLEIWRGRVQISSKFIIYVRPFGVAKNILNSCAKNTLSSLTAIWKITSLEKKFVFYVLS